MLHAYCGSLLCLTVVKPTVIIYPLDYLPVANEKQQEMLDEIVLDVENNCGIERKYISFKDLWLESPPKEAAGKSLHDFLQDVSSPTNQITVAETLNRRVEVRLFTTFARTPRNSAVLTSENVTECPLRTRLLVGDGSWPPLEMCSTSLTPALIAGKSVVTLLPSREETQCNAWKFTRTGFCRKSCTLMIKQLLLFFPSKTWNQIIAILTQGMSPIF